MMELDYENRDYPGEITGKAVRKWSNGANVNNLAGVDYEGTPEDFVGLGVDPTSL